MPEWREARAALHEKLACFRADNPCPACKVTMATADAYALALAGEVANYETEHEPQRDDYWVWCCKWHELKAQVEAERAG